MRKTTGGLLLAFLCLALAPAAPSSSSRACAQGDDCPDEWENWETGNDCEFTGSTVEHAGIEFCAYDCDGDQVLVFEA